MPGQQVTQLEEMPDEIIRISKDLDPGTASDILIGVAPRDMWFERGVFKHSVANGLPLTGTVGYAVDGSAVATDTATISKSGTTIDFNGTANTFQEVEGDPDSNFVPRGALIKVILSGAASAALGTVSADLQFTTRRK